MLLSLGIFALSLAHYSDVAARLDAAKERLERLTARLDPGQHLQSANQAIPVAKSAKVEELIGLHWDEMLSAIEHATTADVAVLSVQADPKKRVVTLNGQARSYDHALGFVQRLPDGKAFENAWLASHMVVEDDPDRPVDFVVEAQWITR